MIPLIPVKKIMSRQIGEIDANEPIVSAARTMKELRTRSLLVKRHEDLVGIVTDVDMTRKVLAEGVDQHKIPVEQVMSSPFYTIEAEDSVAKANELMTQYNVRHLV